MNINWEYNSKCQEKLTLSLAAPCLAFGFLISAMFLWYPRERETSTPAAQCIHLGSGLYLWFDKVKQQYKAT